MLVSSVSAPAASTDSAASEPEATAITIAVVTPYLANVTTNYVIDRFQAGESLPDLAADFGVPIEDLEDALRVASRRAA